MVYHFCIDTVLKKPSIPCLELCVCQCLLLCLRSTVFKHPWHCKRHWRPAAQASTQQPHTGLLLITPVKSATVECSNSSSCYVKNVYHNTISRILSDINFWTEGTWGEGECTLATISTAPSLWNFWMHPWYYSIFNMVVTILPFHQTFPLIQASMEWHQIKVFLILKIYKFWFPLFLTVWCDHYML